MTSGQCIGSFKTAKTCLLQAQFESAFNPPCACCPTPVSSAAAPSVNSVFLLWDFKSLCKFASVSCRTPRNDEEARSLVSIGIAPEGGDGVPTDGSAIALGLGDTATESQDPQASLQKSRAS